MINIHVNSSLCVHLTFDTSDRLWDLQLAFWESHLQDVYPTAHITARCDHLHHQATVSIQFDNMDDLLHWYLTQDSKIDQAPLLTQVSHMLICDHEQKNRNLRIH